MREKHCPECYWVAVVDASGRRQMEMRWQPPGSTSHVRVARAA